MSLGMCFGQERKISSRSCVCNDKSGLSTVYARVYSFTIKKGQPGACSAGRAVAKQTREAKSHLASRDVTIMRLHSLTKFNQLYSRILIYS